MSLKARIEAVIYAAEEPVTLAQLSAIFREEALENRAERMAAEEAARAEAERASQPEAAETELPEASDAERVESEASDTEQAEAPLPDDGEAAAEQETGERPEAEAPSDTAETAEAAPEAAPAAPTEEDEKKAARQRDREVRDEVRRVVDELIADYAASQRGLEIREVAGGFRMATRAEYHDAVRAFVKSLKPPMKLSLQALETLAVIAYKQPITAPEIGEIRGVDSGGVLGSLVARKLITTAGRKQVIGRPILYKTTREFLLRFGLKDVNELPSIEEFEKMASELGEPEETSEERAPEAELPFAESEESGEEPAATSESAEQGEAETPAQAESEAAGNSEPEASEPETSKNEETTAAADEQSGEVADGNAEAQDAEAAPVEEQKS